MNSLLAVAALLGLIAIADGLVVFKVPGLPTPTINRGIE